MESDRRTRIENALWGLFAADALAMPAHWFYKRENIRETFDGGIQKYEDAPHPHPESFMVGMEYKPDIEKAKSLGRPYDILHEHARFYDTSYSDLEIEAGEREEGHGNSTPSLEDRYHYHHGLKAGENTTGAHLVRVLLRSVAENGRYEEETFLDSFVEFLTTPEKLRDPYREIYLRDWFENFAGGKEPRICAAHQRDNWSIGSHGGMIRPMVLAMLGSSDYQGLGFALQHQNLTHRSENVAAALGIAIPLMQDLLRGDDLVKSAIARSATLRVPRVTGEELNKIYRDHEGPGNIPDREMWELHTRLSDDPFDLAELVEDKEDDDVILKKFGTACYPEHGLPLLLFLAANHTGDCEKALLADANAGGDNVHRGAILGLLVGAACDNFPEYLKNGLADSGEIADEIAAFSEVAVSKSTW